MTARASRPGLAGRFLGAGRDAARVPVVLLSGFLGSGKTTLVNAWLRDPGMAGTAVAVNEFGDVPLDAALIDHGADRTVVLANGCLCCNLAGDMEEAMMRLFGRAADGTMPGFRRLLVEPSGLADPAPIAQGILRNPMLSRALRLEAIVTAVDAVFGRDQLHRHAETRKQVALADRLIVTKSDMAPPGAVEALRLDLTRHNPVAPVDIAVMGAIPAAAVLPPRFLAPEAAAETPAWAGGWLAEGGTGAALAGHLATTAAITLTADRPLDWAAVEGWLKGIRLAHAERLLRLKGILDIAGATGPVVVHGVHHVLHAPVEMVGWGASPRISRLVMICDIVIGDNIRDSWSRALPGLLAPA